MGAFAGGLGRAGLGWAGLWRGVGERRQGEDRVGRGEILGPIRGGGSYLVLVC